MLAKRIFYNIHKEALIFKEKFDISFHTVNDPEIFLSFKTTVPRIFLICNEDCIIVSGISDSAYCINLYNEVREILKKEAEVDVITFSLKKEFQKEKSWVTALEVYLSRKYDDLVLEKKRYIGR